jgi:hypothetical protein
MLTAPITVGLNIVVPVVRVRCPAGLLPATLAFPLAFSARAELLPRGELGGERVCGRLYNAFFPYKPLYK